MSMHTNGPVREKLWLLIIVLLVVFCLIFFSAKGKVKIPLTNRIVITLLAPFQSASSKLGNTSSNVIKGVNDLLTVYQENKQLKAQVLQLRKQNMQNNEIAIENERLRKILDYKKIAQQFEMKTATVIARDSSTWVNNIVVNRGANDGIKKDMPVVTPAGLVGYVLKTYDSYSIVALITDPRVAVGVMVQRNESRVAGIIKGDINGSSAVHMENIPRSADVKKGDQIITSGLGGIYPKGIFVGTVEDVQNESGGLLKYAAVKTVVDFQKLEDVIIIVNSQQIPAEKLVQQMQQNADGQQVEKVGANE